MKPQERIAMWNEFMQTDGWQAMAELLDDTTDHCVEELTRVNPVAAIDIARYQAKYNLASELRNYPESQRDDARSEMDDEIETEVI